MDNQPRLLARRKDDRPVPPVEPNKKKETISPYDGLTARVSSSDALHEVTVEAGQRQAANTLLMFDDGMSIRTACQAVRLSTEFVTFLERHPLRSTVSLEKFAMPSAVFDLMRSRIWSEGGIAASIDIQGFYPVGDQEILVYGFRAKVVELSTAVQADDMVVVERLTLYMLTDDLKVEIANGSVLGEDQSTNLGSGRRLSRKPRQGS